MINTTRREFLKGLTFLGIATTLPTSLVSSVLKRKYEKTVVGHGLETYNIWPGVKDLLDPSTVKSMESIKTKSLIHEFNTTFAEDMWVRQVNLIRFVGVTTDTIDEGVEKLAWILEDVNNKFEIKGNLAEAISIPLFGGGFANMSYILINDTPKASSLLLPAWNTVGKKWHDNWNKKWKNYKYSLLEGEMPIYEGSLSVEEFHSRKERLMRSMMEAQYKKIETSNYRITKKT